MYAITGITGQVGSAVARHLLAARQPVRAVLRDAGKGSAWATQGCALAVADINDAAALTAAFTDVDGAFILLPPMFDPQPGFPEVRATLAALKTALLAARPKKTVCLSTIGAQATQPNLLNQLGLMEQAFDALPMPVAYLRAAWFMENAAWDVAPARAGGVIPSFLQPLDRPIPMVATDDIGRVAAGLLQEEWRGQRIIELEGPQRIAPHDIAATFTRILGQPVRMEAVPRDGWRDLFTGQGMRHPDPRIQMLDGFNEGWISFAGDTVKGIVELETVLRRLAAAD